MIEKYKALEAKYERLKPRHEAYVKMLGELLAVLHADGGHYQYEHGTEKAVEDSITKYYELVKQLDEYKRQSQNEAEIKQLEIALRIKTEEHQCCAEDLISLSKSEQELADRINGGWLRPPEKPKGGLVEAIKMARGGDAPIPFKRW